MKLPETLKEITFDFILDYCKANGQVAWLKEIAATEGLFDKNGKERKISFFEIRNAFVEKFFKELAPKAAPKKPTMWDKIKAL